MSQNAIDSLRTLLDEAKAALKDGEFADLEGTAHDVAGLVERIQRDAIGATPDRIAAMAGDLAQAIESARGARAVLDAETRERLCGLLVRTWSQQAGSSPALAAALRRARHDALAVLAAPAGETSLKELQRCRSELESRSVAAAPVRSTGPDMLPAWIGTVESLLEQIEASHLPSAPAWREALRAAGAAGAAAPTRALAEAAESLAAAATEIEAVLLKHQTELLESEEKVRTQAIDRLIEGDLRTEERLLVEGLLLPESEPAGATGTHAKPADALQQLQQILDDRREQARRRLEAALAAAEHRGLPRTELVPASETSLESLRGPARWLAGAAKIESLLAAHEMGTLEGRVVAAIACAWRVWVEQEPGPQKDALFAALADLKMRLAGEGAVSVTESLEVVERLVPVSSPRRETGRDPLAAPSKEELAALESAHPSGARVASGLASQAGAPGSDDAAELMEQAILEARTLAQVRQVAGR